jgi:hypothetical protein
MGGVVLGIFDVFAYSIPGALYLSLIGYVLARTEHLDVAHLVSLNTSLATVGALLASYLLGHVTYLPRALLDRLTGRWLQVRPGAQEEFTRRMPAAAGRPFVGTDAFMVLRAIEIEAPDLGGEINRLRATGLALRNAGYALVLAAFVALGELVAGGHPGLALTTALLLPVAGVLALQAGFVFGHWATLRTYEVAYWLPSIDERLNG